MQIPLLNNNERLRDLTKSKITVAGHCGNRGEMVSLGKLKIRLSLQIKAIGKEHQVAFSIYSFLTQERKGGVIDTSCAMCLVAQSCLSLCPPMDCSPPGSSSVHGILQARILGWVAMPSSRGSSQHRDQTQVSHIAGRFFTI